MESFWSPGNDGSSGGGGGTTAGAGNDNGENNEVDSPTDSGCIGSSRSRLSNASAAKDNLSKRATYHNQRTKSLCVFYNTNILNYARSMAAANNEMKHNKRASGSGISGGQKMGQKEMRILQFNEKIMEAMNKWTGNGKFFLREKSTFLVS